jgi:hypothetical protein
MSRERPGAEAAGGGLEVSDRTKELPDSSNMRGLLEERIHLLRGNGLKEQELSSGTWMKEERRGEGMRLLKCSSKLKGSSR